MYVSNVTNILYKELLDAYIMMFSITALNIIALPVKENLQYMESFFIQLML